MSERRVSQTFEDFPGIDLYSTDLTREPKAAKTLKNFRFGEIPGLKSRFGSVPVGGAGAFKGGGRAHYYNAVSGATVEDVLAVNNGLWKLQSSTLTITRTAGSTTWNFNTALDTAVSRYRFKLYQGGSAVTLVHQITAESAAYLDLGSGFEEEKKPTTSPTAGLITILDLKEAIDAHANFSCAFASGTIYARVNGNQTSTTITIDAGHTLAIKQLVSLWNHATSRLEWREVSATTATTVTFYGSSVQVKDDQVLGMAAAPACSTDLVKDTFGTTADPTNTYTYYYWEPVQTPIGETAWQVTPSAFPSFQASGTSAPCVVSTGTTTWVTTNRGTAATTSVKPFEEYPYVYDGKICVRAGMPPYVVKPTVSFTAAGGSLSAGRYRWALRYYTKNARGELVYGNPSSFYNVIEGTAASGDRANIPLVAPKFNVPADNKILITSTGASATLTLTGAAHAVEINDWVLVPNGLIVAGVAKYELRQVTATAATTVTLDASVNVPAASTYYLYKNPNLGFDSRGARTSLAQANVGSSGAPVVVYGGTYRVGDTLFFPQSKGRGNAFATNMFVTPRTLTGAAATSLYWDTSKEELLRQIGTAITNPEMPISNIVVQVWRTKVNGNTFYLSGEFPADIDAEAFTFEDRISDANLGIQAGFPDIGFEDDLPPKASIACTHQGRVVLTGNPDEPNSVWWSKSDNLQGFPAADNQADIPSTVEGPITAAYADSDDRLAVFKAEGYYELQGDLSGGAAASAVTENDYGITCQSSIAKVDGYIVGLSRLGLIRVKAGVVDAEFYSDLAPAFRKSKAVTLTPTIMSTSARAINYNGEYRLLCIQNSTTSYIEFVHDHFNEALFDASYRPGVAPTGGYVSANRKLYFLCLEANSAGPYGGRFFRELDDLGATSYPEIAYADAIYSIPLEWVFVVNDGNPSVDKSFLRFKLWSLFPEFYNSFVSNTLTVRTYRNFRSSVVNQTFSLVFPAIDTIEDSEKLLSGASRALTFSVSHDVIHATPWITGYEVLLARTHDKEDIK